MVEDLCIESKLLRQSSNGWSGQEFNEIYVLGLLQNCLISNIHTTHTKHQH